ncbi:MAG: AAA family ATPase [Methylotetracoccus sp.]|jgi:type II secretory pathway predicted ATPase ExeA|nr:AAA family ATPase [Methylotetracoccus sp.]MCU0838579.1 AAA family ATPase [Rhodospirillales bacterium]
MYEEFFRLREKPFSLIPDPEYLYLTKGHRMALTLLEYSLSEQTGFVVITGEVGSGKTTLVRKLLTTMPGRLTVGLLTNTHRSFGDLLQNILMVFNLDFRQGSKVDFYQRFVEFVVDQYAQNKRTVLIVDEAQNLDVDVLEELRLLSNINADKDFILQMILVGQPELAEKLRRPELRQFVQRISVDYHLRPLSVEDTIGYIRHRLRVAGGDPELFTTAACCAVYFYAHGVPRLINVLCDLSLVFAYAEEQREIDLDTVIDVAAARALTGLGPFRSDPEEKSRSEVKRLLSELMAGQAQQRRIRA